MTFADTRAAANRHNQTLLARHSAQWINLLFICIFHFCFLLAKCFLMFSLIFRLLNTYRQRHFVALMKQI
jgi:hypothetical protein